MLSAMRLKNPGAIDAAILNVTNQMHACQTALNAHERGPRRQAFMRWCDEAERMLHNDFTSTDLFERLRESHREAQRLDLSDIPTLNGVLNRQRVVWDRRFEDVIAELKTLKVFVERAGHPVVLDTSALMEGDLFTEFDWHTLDDSLKDVPVRLILPSLVIEELDELKRRGETRQKTWARKVLRTLWGLHAPAPTQPVRLPLHADVTIEVFLDDDWHLRRPNNDGEIIDQAIFVRELTGGGTLFASADYAQLYRAAAVGLPVVLMPRRGEDEAPPARKT